MITVRRRRRLRAPAEKTLLYHFIADATAGPAVELTGVNRYTAILFFHKLREVIAEDWRRGCRNCWPAMSRWRRATSPACARGKRRRGAAGKVPVFGLLKHGGKMHAVVIPNVPKVTRSRTFAQTSLRIQWFTNGYRAYEALVDRPQLLRHL